MLDLLIEIPMQIGVDSFVETVVGSGRSPGELGADRVRELLEEVELADSAGVSRITLMMSGGPLPHARMLHSIELLGAKVGPAVRDMARSMSKVKHTILLNNGQPLTTTGRRITSDNC